MEKILLKLVLSGTIATLAGCMSAEQHRQAVDTTAADNLTVGTVQREIRVGMTSAEVVEVLGAPNMVTTDELRREVWVYDKVATEATRSSSFGYGTLILFGGTARSSAVSTSQKTLTVIVKYDEQGRVRDFAYRQSKF